MRYVSHLRITSLIILDLLSSDHYLLHLKSLFLVSYFTYHFLFSRYSFCITAGAFSLIATSVTSPPQVLFEGLKLVECNDSSSTGLALLVPLPCLIEQWCPGFLLSQMLLVME